MYQADQSLTPLLPPESYWSAEHYHRERQRLLQSCWHLVGTAAQLARPDNFVTGQLLEQPIQVRNFAGELHAFANVCAHRHSLLTSVRAGSSASMRCQYHGWEYGSDGRTRKIPEARQFSPFDREAHRLQAFRVERCGQLVFVSLSERGPSLREQLGDLAVECENRFGNGWEETLTWESEYPANWKVPIENALEAYHVPCIHPDSFREDPGPDRSVHEILAHRSALITKLPFCAHSRVDRWFQSTEGWVMRRLGVLPTGDYRQYHVFPNLLFSFTDAVSLCQCVTPTGATRSRGLVRQFGRSDGNRMFLSRGLARGWGRIAAAITRRILSEDRALFADVQRGLEASRHTGLLGANEERIHAFQRYIVEHCAVEETPATERSTAARSVEPASFTPGAEERS